MRQLPSYGTDSLRWKVGMCCAILLSTIAISYFTAQLGEVVPMLTIGLSVVTVFLVLLFRKPVVGLFALLIYTFVLPISRELGFNIQWGIGQEILLLLTWTAVIFHRNTNGWSILKSDIVGLMIAWFGLSVLQVANPAGADVMGWLHEIRTTALLLVMVVPLTMLLFTKKEQLDVFLKVGIALSVFAALNGIKQLHIGLSPGEQQFLADNPTTHQIFGQLRVFSFFTDAGQFGASQAHFAVISFILAMGPFARWKRVFLILIGILLFYGMMISGTRGAFFVLTGGLVGLILTKNFRLLAIGMVMMMCLVLFLKFTSFGQGNYHVRRLRTAVNPTTDASYQVRLNSQMVLRDYLRSKPFGGGLGTIGVNGNVYNPGTFLANIEPDSYWVKVWAMYGIVGFTFWFGIMMYIMGKCCGIVWNIRDPVLKIKLIALVSGTIGVFISSYGNEVINRIPSSVVVLMSWAIIYVSPRWDKKPDAETASLDT